MQNNHLTASLLSTNSFAEKYGLHGGFFGTLPVLEDYQSLLLHPDNLFAFDITHELELLSIHQGAMLTISVPTCGYTDPAMDYLIAPMFALPSIMDGCVAKTPGQLIAHVMGTDIRGNRYPLFTQEQGKIDFTLIEKTLNDNIDRFTTLLEITYGFTFDDINQVDSLILACPNKRGKFELFIPSNVGAFDFQINVVLDHKVLSQQTIQYKPKPEQPKGRLVGIWQEGNQKSYLHINYKLPSLTYKRGCARAKVVIDVPLQEGVDYTWQSAKGVKGQDGKTLRFTQYYGLSEHAFKQVIFAILPQTIFKDKFLNGLTQAGMFNRYDLHGDLVFCLYENLIHGVLNESVPLYALSPYFAQDDLIKANMAKIITSAFDEHDQFVLTQLKELVNDKSAQAFIDEVDRLLSSQAHYGETTLVIETMHKPLQPISSPLIASFVLESKDNQVLCMTTDQAFIQIINKNRIFVKEKHSRFEKGERYTIGVHNLTDGVDIIENFNWEENDKINLTEIVNTLRTQKGGSYVVNIRITPTGDTEIWIAHSQKGDETAHYHIATLKGISTLPKDISRFIEVGRNG